MIFLLSHTLFRIFKTRSKCFNENKIKMIAFKEKKTKYIYFIKGFS